MALVTANNITVISAIIDMPLQGVFTADLHLDNPDGSGFDGGTKVSIVSPYMTWVGVVDPNRTGDFLDSSHVRVIGGGGGMAKAVPPQGYTQPGAFFKDVANGIASNAGETLSTSIDPSLLGTNLTAWATLAGPASDALQTLIDFVVPGASWRILADGTLWIGQESWPTATGDFQILTQDPAQQFYELGVESPFLTPGVAVDLVGQISRVVHTIESDKVRSSVWTVAGARGPQAAVKALVSQATAEFDYFGLYEAKVISQSGNKVDLQPVLAKIPPVTGCSLRHGLPGVSVTVVPGCTVLFGWDSGDPRLPYACLWGGGETVLSLSIGSAADAVLTKADMTALIQAIATATYINAAGVATTLVFVPPTAYGSNTIKFQR